jgi:hypothetical protein
MDKWRSMERKAGRFIISANVNEAGELSEIVWAGYGPGDLVLDVWNCSISLSRAVRSEQGYHLESVLRDEDYDDARVAHWLDSALRAAGGYINLSGHYPLVRSVPQWLKALMLKAEAND